MNGRLRFDLKPIQRGIKALAPQMKDSDQAGEHIRRWMEKVYNMHQKAKKRAESRKKEVAA